MNRLVIGLAVASDRLRAVGVRGDAVRWAIDAERRDDEPLESALAALLARCPLPRWPRPVVVGAIGPAAVQVKRITGLPPLTEPRDLEAVVRESPRRFFLQNGVPLVSTGVQLVDVGTGWAAAFDAPVVTAVEGACRAAKLPLVGIVPTAAALPYALSDAEIAWHDGPVRADISVERGQLIAVRRTGVEMMRDAAPPPPATPVTALASLGERALSFADAYGATRVPRDAALFFRRRTRESGAQPSRRRIAVAAAACATAVSIAVMAPSVTAWYVGRKAAARLATLGATDRTLRTRELELARVTSALREMNDFDASRRSPTRLLRDLARALPEHSALVALTIDTTGGTFVALAPRAADIVNALDHVPGLASPTLIGPVTRETVGAQNLDRVTVRFRRPGEAP